MNDHGKPQNDKDQAAELAAPTAEGRLGSCR